MGLSQEEQRELGWAAAEPGQSQWVFNRSWAREMVSADIQKILHCFFLTFPGSRKREYFVLPWQTPVFTALIRRRKYLQE